MFSRKLCLILLLIFLPALPASLSAQTEKYRGEVVSVADGDTITVLTTDFERIKVRFYGIDCPEKGQPFGEQAKSYLNTLLYGKTVDIEVLDIDRYSRYVGIVRFNSQSVNNLLMSEGLAWYYAEYCREESVCAELKASERQARRQKKGLWSDSKSIPPWDWRRSKRS